MKGVWTTFLFLFILSALAQPQIEVSTNKSDYANGEIIEIAGKVTEGGNPFQDKFVSLEIRDSTDEVKYVSTKTTNSSGEFKDSLVLPKSDTKSVYSLTIAIENARQTITFKYGGGNGQQQEKTGWMYWALGGFGVVIVVLFVVIVTLLSRQKKREVRHVTREQRIEQLTRQIEEIEGKYGITERSSHLREKLEEMKR